MAKPQNEIQIATRNLMTYAFLLSTFFFCVLAPAQEPMPDVETIIKKIDQLYRSETSEAEIEMHIVTPHWERTLAMTRLVTRDGQNFYPDYGTEEGTRCRDPAHRQ